MVALERSLRLMPNAVGSRTLFPLSRPWLDTRLMPVATPSIVLSLISTTLPRSALMAVPPPWMWKPTMRTLVDAVTLALGMEAPGWAMSARSSRRLTTAGSLHAPDTVIVLAPGFNCAMAAASDCPALQSTATGAFGPPAGGPASSTATRCSSACTRPRRAPSDAIWPST
jgi:hypothetical protein